MRAALTVAALALALTACGSSGPSSTAANPHPVSPTGVVSPSPTPPTGAAEPTFSTVDVTGQPPPVGAYPVVMQHMLYSPTTITVTGSSFSLLLQNQEVDSDQATCHINVLPNWCRHNMQVRSGTPQGPLIGQSDTVDLGKSAVFTVHNLRTGRYVFSCSVFNHWYESGMKGLLTVQ